MGATNNTTYYNLSQFVGTDKPAWLQDYNGDMTKIDAGIHQAKAAADAAQGDATQALTDSGLNTTAIGNIQTDVGNLQTAVGNNTGSITTINSLIGNGTPTTTDQTIIGAINELNAKAGIFKEVHAIEVVADGVKTRSALLDELFAALTTYLTDPDNPYSYYSIGRVRIINSDFNTPDRRIIAIGAPNTIRVNNFSDSSNTDLVFTEATITTSGSSEDHQAVNYSSGTWTFTSYSSNVPADGSKFTIILNMFT